MKSRKKTVSKPKNEWHFVDKVYRWLPVFLLLFGAGNCYFIIKYVNQERTDFEEVKRKALVSVTNTYAFVESSLTHEISKVRHELSNEVQRVRFSNEMRLRSVYNNIVATNNVSFAGVQPVQADTVYQKPSFVNARYFRLGGVPYLDFGSGVYFTIGGDFGYGVIERIFPTGVFCDGVFYKLDNIKKEIVTNDVP